MKKVLVFIMTGILVVLVILALVFLPGYAAKREDAKYINQYQLYERDIVTDDLTMLSLAEKLTVLSLADKESIRNNIFSAHTYDNLLKSDKTLLNNLESHIKQLEKLKLIPVFSGEINWQKDFVYGELYNLSHPENPSKVLSVWHLNFYNREELAGEYNFLVDAHTHQIYEFYLSSREMDSYIEEACELVREEGLNDFAWANYWMKQYGIYLAGNDLENSRAYWETDVVDFYGMICLDNVEYYIESRVDNQVDASIASMEEDIGIFTFYFAPSIGIYDSEMESSQYGK